ncbi:MAG TPA: MarR family transcriptional regulator [Puia sp.]|nr:MarR family transcriptional regulator [Puia sp.]
MASAGDQQLAHSLRDLVSRLSRNLRKQISNPEQLSVAEENVVRVLLEQEEAPPSELCAQLNISSQFMSQVLNRLEELDYVSRKPSTTDKRKSLVSMSKKGMQKIEQRRQAKEDLLATLISKQYSRQEKEIIEKAILLLARLYEER